MTRVTQQKLLVKRSPKRDHGSVTRKKQKGPRPASQRTIAKNLATVQKEVGETVPRIIKARNAFRLP
jgi:hypothetical protein